MEAINLAEAKEIMKMVGVKNVFAVYELELGGIAEVRECNNKGEFLELEKRLENLSPNIEVKLKLDPKKPIECPLDSSMSSYLEFNIQNKTIKPCSIKAEEYEQIENKIKPLVEEYKWEIIK